MQKTLKIKLDFYYGIGFVLAADFNEKEFYVVLPFVAITIRKVNKRL